MRCNEDLEPALLNAINEKLIDYIMRFPFPYIDILREQIATCQITNEWHFDCYIMHFHRTQNTIQLPPWLPTAPQGFQVLKENGPLSCLLYVESGYIVQFEVIDMGMNEIDWEYLWSHEPIFDHEYDLSAICSYLTTEKLRIIKKLVRQHDVYLRVETVAGSNTVCLWNCSFLSPELLHNAHDCSIDICASGNDNHPYLVRFNDNPVLECSLVSLQEYFMI